MGALMTHTAKLFSPADVENVAKEMQAEDEDWTYVVRHDPTGNAYSLIDIFDEDGELVGQV